MISEIQEQRLSYFRDLEKKKGNASFQKAVRRVFDIGLFGEGITVDM
jgi:hypothetical protein